MKASFRHLALATCCALLGLQAAAAADSIPGPRSAEMPVPRPPDVPARAYILMDHVSGRVIAELNSGQRMEPASLTKIMTSYIVFDAIRRKLLTLQDPVVISEHAWKSEGSRSFVQVGTRIPAEVLIKGMIVQSGNDATIALAERIGGSESGFAQMMNAQAKRLGLAGTHFDNSWGGPSPTHYSTPRDLAILSRALIRDFPEYYRWYSLREFVHGGIHQRNRNGLLARDPTVDGIKTGHTETALYCLASSAKRGDMRLVSIVLGSPSEKTREDASLALLNYGFTFYETLKIRDGGSMAISPRVYRGAEDFVNAGIAGDLFVTVARGESARLQKVAAADEPLLAPIARGARIGTYSVTLDGKTVAQAPLVALEEVPEAGFFGRASDSVRLWFE